MKIFRILDVGKYEPHATTYNRLGTYSHDIHSVSGTPLKVRNISNTTDNLTLINNKEILGVSTRIKRGISIP